MHARRSKLAICAIRTKCCTSLNVDASFRVCATLTLVFAVTIIETGIGINAEEQPSTASPPATVFNPVVASGSFSGRVMSTLLEEETEMDTDESARIGTNWSPTEEPEAVASEVDTDEDAGEHSDGHVDDSVPGVASQQPYEGWVPPTRPSSYLPRSRSRAHTHTQTHTAPNLPVWHPPLRLTLPVRHPPLRLTMRLVMIISMGSITRQCNKTDNPMRFHANNTQ